MLHKKQAVQYVNQLMMISIIAKEINAAKKEYSKYAAYNLHDKSFKDEVKYWALNLRLLKIGLKMLQRGATFISIHDYDMMIPAPSKNAMILHDGKLRDPDTIILGVEQHLKRKQAAKNA